MDSIEKQEEKNKRVGWLTSVGVQLVLLVLFYFIVAWKEPFPPIPEYGIELGFTTSSGAVAAPPPSPQQPVEETIEEVESEDDQVQDEVIPVQNQEAEEVESQEVETQEVENISVVEEQESKPETTTEEVVEEQIEEVQVDERAVMTSSEEESDSEEESEGEEETPVIDERALYGSQGENTGADEGASLSLSGWIWDFKPEPDDQSDQTGKIEYKIVVDQDGYLVKIETTTSTVSPAVERKYRQAVERLTFSKTADYKVAPLSTGTITFIIKSR